MTSDDDDKTVFGQPLPGAPRPEPRRPTAAPPPRQQAGPPPQPPRPAPPAGAQPPGAEKTVFGQPMPGGSGGRVAPTGQTRPAAQPSTPPPRQGHARQDPHGYPTPQPGYQGGQAQGHPPPQGYAPPQGHPPQQGHPPHQGHPPQQGHPPPQGYAPPRGNPQPGYHPPQQPQGYGQPPPPHSGYPSPNPQQQGWGPPASDDDTWLIGGSPAQQPGRPQQPRPPHDPLGRHVDGGYRPETGRRDGAELFPDVPPRQQPYQPQPHRKIPLEQALRGSGIGAGGSSNPLIASAANVLILLGRLRTGLVEMQSAPLLDHVAREIDLFERNAAEAGMAQQDVIDAKYALCATADDIVLNLPGADRDMWRQYSMGARFFNDRNAGIGLFQRIDQVMKAPGQRFYLLELLLTCLSLGFEGQYRGMPNGPMELARIRSAIYESMRRVRARPDEDISVRWMPVVLQGRQRRTGVPLWAVAGIGAMMTVALFATLAGLLRAQAAQTGDRITAMHMGLPTLTLLRTEPVAAPPPVRQTPEPPDPSQIDRIRAGLAAPIEAGDLSVGATNDYIFIRVGEYLRFASGRATLTSDFETLAAEIATVLDRETGPIKVVGHSDSIPLSGRGQFKTNLDLSTARARTVGDILGAAIAEPDRITVDGKGAADPIATNDTAEGRARNRRVEILVPRES